MKPTEKIKRLIKNAKIKTDPKVNEAVLNDLLNQLDKSQSMCSASGMPNLWRTIMKSRITKLAVAAVMIIVVMVGGYVLLEKSAQPAWALEKAVKALADVNGIKMIGKMNQKGCMLDNVVIWAKATPDGKQSELIRIESAGVAAMIGNKEGTYAYSIKDNIVSIQPPSTMQIQPWLNADFFEKMSQWAQDKTITYGKDAITGNSAVFMNCKGQDNQGHKAWWFEFDAQTNLPVKFKQWNNGDTNDVPTFDIKEITFNPEFPAKVFDFTIPKGAQVIDNRNTKAH